jgi:acyl-CoA synthetase (AMP-forming)/AMP-acid ligase II
MTEVGIISLRVLRAGSTAPLTSIGRALDVERTRVIAPDGTFLLPGQVGEIALQSPIFSGYWNNPEANEAAFIGGWFRTGDEGFMDADGNITLVGRVKEVINSGGAKVSPLEVEAVLMQHPDVKEAAVFGLKHPEVGETVAAAVVGAVSERELRRFAAERLPFYKVPMRIVIVEAIPIGASGKVQRNRLATLLGLT